MLDKESYSFFSKSEHNFQIYFGDSIFIKQRLTPNKIFLGLPYPSPSSGSVSIPYTIPDSINVRRAKLTIRNIAGEEIHSVDLSTSSGFYTYKMEL